MRLGRVPLVALVVALMAMSPSPGDAAVGLDTGPAPAPVARLLDDGGLAVRSAGIMPLAELLREIARALGAEAIIRRDPGEVGPVHIEGLDPAEALRRLAGRNSLVLDYRDGRVVRIVLIAARDREVGPPRSVVAKIERRRPLPLPLPLSAEQAARNMQAVAIRDIIQLSYRTDGGAVAELARTLTGSDDPAIRRAAASALGSIGTDGAVRLLSRRALADPDPELRLRAAESLVLARGEGAAARLRGAVSTDPDPTVRAGLLRLLSDGLPGAGGAGDGPHAERVTR